MLDSIIDFCVEKIILPVGILISILAVLFLVLFISWASYKGISYLMIPEVTKKVVNKTTNIQENTMVTPICAGKTTVMTYSNYYSRNFYLISEDNNYCSVSAAKYSTTNIGDLHKARWENIK